MSYIEFKNVDKIYKMGEIDLKALDNASFEINKGELVVILGQSGSGKSTCLNILGGMFSTTAYFNVKIHNDTFKEFTKEMNTTIFNAYKHLNFTEHYLKELFEENNDKRNIPSNVVMSYQDLSEIKSKVNIDCQLTGDNNFGTFGLNIFIIHILEQENNNISISYDYLREKFSKEDILRVNQGIVSIIRQVVDNEDISIEYIEV